jgi:hypothetical protein
MELEVDVFGVLGKLVKYEVYSSKRKNYFSSHKLPKFEKCRIIYLKILYKVYKGKINYKILKYIYIINLLKVSKKFVRKTKSTKFLVQSLFFKNKNEKTPIFIIEFQSIEVINYYKRFCRYN